MTVLTTISANSVTEEAAATATAALRRAEEAVEITEINKNLQKLQADLFACGFVYSMKLQPNIQIKKY